MKSEKQKAEMGRIINQKKNNERLMKGKELNKSKSKQPRKTYV